MKPSNREQQLMMEEASQLVCWCVTIALHRMHGIGKGRLEKIAEEMQKIQTQYAIDCRRFGVEGGYKRLLEGARHWVEPEWRTVIMDRPKRAAELNRELIKNEQRSHACTLAWCMFSMAIRTSQHWGKARLKTLKEETRELFDRFEQETKEDGKDVAYEHIKRFAEQAMQEECILLEDGEEAAALSTDAWIEEMIQESKRVNGTNVKAAAVALAKKEKSPCAECAEHKGAAEGGRRGRAVCGRDFEDPQRAGADAEHEEGVSMEAKKEMTFQEKYEFVKKRAKGVMIAEKRKIGTVMYGDAPYTDMLIECALLCDIFPEEVPDPNNYGNFNRGMYTLFIPEEKE